MTSHTQEYVTPVLFIYHVSRPDKATGLIELIAPTCLVLQELKRVGAGQGVPYFVATCLKSTATVRLEQRNGQQQTKRKNMGGTVDHLHAQVPQPKRAIRGPTSHRAENVLRHRDNLIRAHTTVSNQQ